MIKIMLTDDHKMIRQGLKLLIEQDKECCVVGEAENGEECLDNIDEIKPDVLILDINMPEMNGMEVLKRLSGRKLRPKILILTLHNEIEYLIKAFDMGAEGYVLKNSDFRELVRAIHSVYDGEKYIQPNLIPFLNAKLIGRELDREKINSLSPRELEVLKLVATGLLNKEVGGMLCISERTVKNHLSNIYRKIDCYDRTQAAVFCMRNELVSPNI